MNRNHNIVTPKQYQNLIENEGWLENGKVIAKGVHHFNLVHRTKKNAISVRIEENND